MYFQPEDRILFAKWSDTFKFLRSDTFADRILSAWRSDTFREMIVYFQFKDRILSAMIGYFTYDPSSRGFDMLFSWRKREIIQSNNVCAWMFDFYLRCRAYNNCASNSSNTRWWTVRTPDFFRTVRTLNSQNINIWWTVRTANTLIFKIGRTVRTANT